MRGNGNLVAALAALLPMALLVGCDAGAPPTATPPDAATAREAVVAVRFSHDNYWVVQSGVSLGDGYVATYYPWREEPPAGLAAEVLHGAEGTLVAPASLVRADPEGRFVLLRADGASLPAVGEAVALAEGAGVTVAALAETGSGPGPAPEPTGPVALREEEGRVLAVGVAPPDPRAAEPPATPASGRFVAIEAPGWAGLPGGLVLDEEGRPAAMVVLAQIITGGSPGANWAIPLEEVTGAVR